MNKALATFFLYSLTIALSIAIMVYGWGLRPDSWLIVIGGNTVCYILIEIMKGISKGGK